MRSIVMPAASLLIGVSLLAANYYFWGLVWDWLVGPIPASRFPMMGKSPGVAMKLLRSAIASTTNRAVGGWCNRMWLLKNSVARNSQK